MILSVRSLPPATACYCLRTTLRTTLRTCYCLGLWYKGASSWFCKTVQNCAKRILIVIIGFRLKIEPTSRFLIVKHMYCNKYNVQVMVILVLFSSFPLCTMEIHFISLLFNTVYNGNTSSSSCLSMLNYYTIEIQCSVMQILRSGSFEWYYNCRVA